ncbi:hypothetical protein EDF46_3570 [Frondihabitans sp. PhB188]|uniref:hypothetical protein n=1 Tax=Frondihabitans sp. PhB188 TaxID=2485200 RepID=UPI000F9B1D25|nr:hypothetical protein [Frondihabitans sp. PhB188]ROQ30257.1 hypothetical protein EDF46_3570 [Frondihabitans sp. PhB188]
MRTQKASSSYLTSTTLASGGDVDALLEHSVGSKKDIIDVAVMALSARRTSPSD